MEQWSVDEVADEVRNRLATASASGNLYEILEVAIDQGTIRLRLTVRRDPTTYEVALPCQPPYLGVSTGEPCRSAHDWAEEVGWMLEEEIDTRRVDTAGRTLLTGGVVRLHL